MMKRFISGLVVALGLAGAGNAAAQEILITGPLAGAPAVRKERLYRQGRFEIAPTVAFTLLDEYRRTMFAGARIQYNFTEWLSFGVFAAYGVWNPQTDLTTQIDSNAPRNEFTYSQVNRNGSFADQTAKLNWMLNPQFQFTPFRGKLALFQKVFVDTDAYLHVGVGFVGLQERAPCGAAGQPGCADPNSYPISGGTPLTSKVEIAPTFGLGLNFYLTDFMSLGIEYRAFPFLDGWNRAGFDTRGGGNNGKAPDGKIDGKDDTFAFNQMVGISLGFSLPAKPKISE